MSSLSYCQKRKSQITSICFLSCNGSLTSLVSCQKLFWFFAFMIFNIFNSLSVKSRRILHLRNIYIKILKRIFLYRVSPSPKHLEGFCIPETWGYLLRSGYHDHPCDQVSDKGNNSTNYCEKFGSWFFLFLGCLDFQGTESWGILFDDPSIMSCMKSHHFPGYCSGLQVSPT